MKTNDFLQIPLNHPHLRLPAQGLRVILDKVASGEPITLPELAHILGDERRGNVRSVAPEAWVKVGQPGVSFDGKKVLVSAERAAEEFHRAAFGWAHPLPPSNADDATRNAALAARAEAAAAWEKEHGITL